MSRPLRKLFTGVLNIFSWLVFGFAVFVSLIGFLSQAVRTSRRQSFKNNIHVLIISIAYSVVVRLPSFLFLPSVASFSDYDDESSSCRWHFA
jgi:hypothetical protein